MAFRTPDMAEHALSGAVQRVAVRLSTERYRDLSDRQLLERFLHQHDEGAFAALVRRHQRCVYAALNRVLSDPDDLEDAFQATFLVLVRRASSVRWQEGLGTWLYAVAHRVAVSARVAARTRLHHEEQAAGLAETTAAPADLSCREACELVHEELDRLPETLRLPLLLCCLEGKSRDEAALQLGVSVGVVKGRLERGRNLLRDRLLKRGVPLTAALLVALAHSTARASAPHLVQTTLAALAGPSARVAALANGVSATMILSKFKLGLGLLLLAGLLAALGSRLGAARPVAEDEQEAKRPVAAKAPAAKEGEWSGRVLDDAGKPVAGAKLSLWLGKGKARDVGASDREGRFRLRVGKADLDRSARLIARAMGHGADWVDLRNRPAGEVTLRLGAVVAIQGRIVDLEGQPVAGAVVTVRLVAKEPGGNLTKYIDDIRKPRTLTATAAGGGGSSTSSSVITPLLSLPPKVLGLTAALTSDKTGRFRLEGVARERLVFLDVQARGMVLKSAEVVTRPGFKKIDRFLGPVFDLPLAPGKEVVGVVKEKGTGRLVVGARVTVGGARVAGNNPTRTDERGTFRIEGLLKRPQYRVHVDGPDHFPTVLTLKDTPGRDPVRGEIEVDRGIHVEGRLLDGATGKPVAGTVEYAASADSPAVKTLAFFPGEGLGAARVGPDGKFHLLVLSGPGYLAARASENRFARLVPEGWTGSVLASLPRQLLPQYYHATVAINPDEKKPASLTPDVKLDPGLRKSGSIVDAHGKPVSDVIVLGLTAVPAPSRWGLPVRSRSLARRFQLKESTFEAVGLNPKQPRYLVFVHPEKKLGKVLRVRGDEKGPLVVKLEPLGAVSGHVRTKEGKAVARQAVLPDTPQLLPFYKDYPIDLLLFSVRALREAQLLGRGGSPDASWPAGGKTDDEGRFRIDGLVPGLRYTLTVEEQGARPGARPSHLHQNVTVESGKTRDVGDLPRVPGP